VSGESTVFVFGATGSVGAAAVDVCGSLGLRVVGLGAGSRADVLASLAQTGGAKVLHVADSDAARPLSDGPWRVLTGVETASEAVIASGANVVVNAVSGASGMAYSFAALDAGVERLALANKESLVMAGELLLSAAESAGVDVLPVDSEHAALLLLMSAFRGRVRRIALTASGGPFLNRDDLSDVTPEEALAHPVWSMGRRITVDSGTLMNKVFEVVEAHVLFGFDYDHIDVLVHPEGVVHAAVVLGDGVTVRQAAPADMRCCIQQALTWPERGGVRFALDLTEAGPLRFFRPEPARFEALAALEDLKSGASPAYRIALNAADEVAVEEFLEGRLPFDAIAKVALEVARSASGRPGTPEEVMEADVRFRETALEICSRWRS